MAVATWNFNGTLAADEPGVALTAIDPLGTSAGLSPTVFGINHRISFRRQPDAEPTGWPVHRDNRSSEQRQRLFVDIVFQFESNQSTWENIFGVSNRQSDNARFMWSQETTFRSGQPAAGQRSSRSATITATLTNRGDGTVTTPTWTASSSST